MRSLKLGVAAIALAIAFIACSGNPVSNSSNGNRGNGNVAVVAAPSEMGQKIYKQNCAACHKESGTGGKMVFEGKTLEPDDLTSDKLQRVSDQKLFEYITEGVPDEGMPAFKTKLKEPEIREVVSYIRVALQKKERE